MPRITPPRSALALMVPAAVGALALAAGPLTGATANERTIEVPAEVAIENKRSVIPPGSSNDNCSVKVLVRWKAVPNAIEGRPRVVFWRVGGGPEMSRAIAEPFQDRIVVDEQRVFEAPPGYHQIEIAQASQSAPGPGSVFCTELQRFHENAGYEALRVEVQVEGSEAQCRGLKATQVGTPGRDVIRGTRGRDVIQGLAGNDLILGLGGNDVLCGGPGNDVLLGGSGNDVTLGETGRDTARGGPGRDLLLGGPGNDRQYGDAGNDLARGGAGNDLFRGGGGVDRGYGDAGSDRQYGGPGNDRLYGGANNDRNYGQAGNDLLVGDSGRDLGVGGPGRDRFVSTEIRIS